MNIALPIEDAAELAELLDWIAEFLTNAPQTTTDTFNNWAHNSAAAPNLTQDLRRWASQLRTTTPT